MRVTLFIAILFLGWSAIQAQPALAPLSHNVQLFQSAEIELRNAFDYEEEVYIQSGRMYDYCLDLALLSNPFRSMQVETGQSTIIGGSPSVVDSCFSYAAFAIQSNVVDTVLLSVKDDQDLTYLLRFIIHVRTSEALPFLDDFSYEGPFPDHRFWIDRDVFINNGLASRPLSIGVATFDGVDADGGPYGGGTGISDYLTSTFFNLDGAGDAVLEFYYQPRGNGFANFPRPEDSLIVQFRTEEGDWQRMASFAGIGDQPTPDFTYFQIPVPESFQYDGFQFRFVNISPNDGVLAMWHLDYVQLSDDPAASAAIADIAFTSAPPSLFRSYTAIPSAQFKNNVNSYLAEDIEIGIGSYFVNNGTVPVSRLRFLNEEGTNLTDETLLEVPPVVAQNQRDLAPGQYSFMNPIKERNTLVQQVINLNIQTDDSASLETMYSMSPNNQGSLQAFRRNDTVRFVSELKDYFAYDDGTAEVGIYIQGGTQFDLIAQEYELVEGDSLKAIRMFFPYVFNQGNRQRFELMIWGERLEDGPIYQKIYDQPVFPDRFGQRVGSFTNFALKTATDQDTSLFVPSGKFYVGWRQISANTTAGLYVGFDKSRPEIGDKIYYNKTGTWQKLSVPTIQGAIMIRPVFGKERQISTNQSDQNFKGIWTAYPNPSSGWLNLKGDVRHEAATIEIISLQGQSIKSIGFESQINISDLLPGRYILVIQDRKGNILDRLQIIKI